MLLLDPFRFRRYLLPRPGPGRGSSYLTTTPSSLYHTWLPIAPLTGWPFGPFAPRLLSGYHICSVLSSYPALLRPPLCGEYPGASPKLPATTSASEVARAAHLLQTAIPLFNTKPGLNLENIPHSVRHFRLPDLDFTTQLESEIGIEMIIVKQGNSHSDISVSKIKVSVMRVSSISRVNPSTVPLMLLETKEEFYNRFFFPDSPK